MFLYNKVDKCFLKFVSIDHFECSFPAKFSRLTPPPPTSQKKYIYIYIYIFAQSEKYFICKREIISIFPLKRKNKSKTFIWTGPKNVQECQRWLFTIFAFSMKICNDQWWILMNCSNHNPRTIRILSCDLLSNLWEPVEFCFLFYFHTLFSTTFLY